MDLRPSTATGKIEHAVQMARMQYWMDTIGVSGFYVDQAYCPGSFDLLVAAQAKWGASMPIYKEGATDINALHFPQIPIIKHKGASGVKLYNRENSLLLNYLTPLSTYYGGQMDTFLNKTETLAVMRERNYTAIVTNQMLTRKKIDPEYHCEIIKLSYTRQLWQWEQYGHRIGGCPRPLPPPACPPAP
jgi:hypothetical protein